MTDNRVHKKCGLGAITMIYVTLTCRTNKSSSFSIFTTTLTCPHISHLQMDKARSNERQVDNMTYWPKIKPQLIWKVPVQRFWRPMKELLVETQSRMTKHQDKFCHDHIRKGHKTNPRRMQIKHDKPKFNRHSWIVNNKVAKVMRKPEHWHFNHLTPLFYKLQGVLSITQYVVWYLTPFMLT